MKDILIQITPEHSYVWKQKMIEKDYYERAVQCANEIENGQYDLQPLSKKVLPEENIYKVDLTRGNGVLHPELGVIMTQEIMFGYGEDFYVLCTKIEQGTPVGHYLVNSVDLYRVPEE